LVSPIGRMPPRGMVKGAAGNVLDIKKREDSPLGDGMPNLDATKTDPGEGTSVTHQLTRLGEGRTAMHRGTKFI